MTGRLASGIVATLIAVAAFAPTKTAETQTLSACGVTHGFNCGTAHVTLCLVPMPNYCAVTYEYDVPRWQTWIYES